MKKSERKMLILFLAPVIIFYLAIYLYPTIRTFLMTLYEIPGVSVSMNQWSFAGIKNFQEVLKSPLFRRSFSNIIIIMLVGGVFTFLFAMMFACLLRSGMKVPKLWKAIIYLPNVITPVAMVTMWTQYAFNNKFGFFKTIFDVIGLHGLADIPWTSAQYSFWAMLIAYTFGGIGYYMVMFMASMDKVPQELYDCAALEGCNGFQSFFRITLPLIKDNIKTAVIFWCLGCLNFFLWSRVFSVNVDDPVTLSPANFMYTRIFGSSSGNAQVATVNVGLGATVGVILCVCAVIVYLVCELAFGKEKYEY